MYSSQVFPAVRTVVAWSLLAAPVAAFCAASSPDGRQLAYSYIGGPENIYLVDTDGSNVVPLVVRDQRDFRPEWAPDGSHIVFTSVVDGVHVIMRVDRDGGNLRRLSELAEAAGDPDYSPDGKRLVYFTDEPQPRDLFVRDLATGQVTALTMTPDFEEMSPRWAPDGRRVVFVGKSVAEDAESDIWILDTLTGERRNVTASPKTGEFHPDWSNDGSRLIYIRVKDGDFAVVVSDLESCDETIVADGNGYAVLSPHFSPDDANVLFTRTDFAEQGEGMPAIVRVSLVDGSETRVAKGLYPSQIAAQSAGEEADQGTASRSR